MATRNSEARDFRQDLTNNIIGLIESGTAPWQKPWDANAAGAALSLPFNATTERAYRGANSLHLMARQMQLGSSDPRWCTYKQAQAEGWQVRKGEKGTTVEYWQFDREEERAREGGASETVRVKLDRPRVFYATVFNAQQLDGISPYQPAIAKKQWEVSEAAERVLAACGVPIHHDQQDRAYYSPAADSIHMPPRAGFPKQEDYYEVALHEVGHSTGHSSRLNRDLSGVFGSPAYAREELRAQMCSLYLSAELGLPFNPERHAAYQSSWIEALKQDKNEIFRAARDAELMADYVIGLSREHTLTKEIDMAETATLNPDAAEMQAAPQSPEVSPEMKKLFDVADARTGNQAKMYLPRDSGKYTGKVIEISERYALQQLRESNSFVVHSLDKLNGQQIKAGERYLMEYKDGVLAVRAPEQAQSRAEPGQATEKTRQSQDRAGEQPKTFDSELVQLKNEHAGKDAKLVMAKDEDGKAYTGTIIAETGNKVLQRVSDKYVVVHEKNKLARDVEVGSNKTLAYENGRIDVLEPSQDRNRSRAQEADRAGERAPDEKNKLTPEQERRESFFQTRGIIMSQFGAESKVRDAKTDIGDYKGAIVAITKDHVAQQLGANSFVVHEKDRLAGNFHKGSHVEIKYNNGRAISSLTQQQRDQSREQSQGRGVSR